MRDFDAWLKQLRPSIATYGYYINFEKVIENAKEYKAELHLLNSLVGSSEVEAEFRKLADKYPDILRCVPVLLAVRQHEIFARDESEAEGGRSFK